MKRLTITCLTIAALASPAAADLFYESDIVDGVRVLQPKDDSRLNARGAAVQKRIFELGFFSWPLPVIEAPVTVEDGPAFVVECSGHDPEYLPANKVPFEGDLDEHNILQAKGNIYDLFAYRNALSLGDCSCGSLKADWGQTLATYDQINDGLDEPTMQANVLSNLRKLIHNDFERMCHVRLLRDLE